MYYIYLCVILHATTGRPHRDRYRSSSMQIEGQICGIEAVQCGSSSRALGGYKSASWSVLLDNFRPYSSRVVAMAVAVIHAIGTVFGCTAARAVPFSSFNAVLKDVKNHTMAKLRAWLLQFGHFVVLSLPI